jgi:putative hydrolase of the HAD superfamily
MGARFDCVIFDFGGVLSLPQDAERVTAMAAQCHLSLDVFRREYSARRPALDRGDIDRDGYWTPILAAGSVPPSPQILNRLAEEDMLGWTRINGRTLAWSYELRRAGMGTAILSNMPRYILDMMRLQKRFDWISDFPLSIFSCDVRLAKPEPPLYALCLEKLGLPAKRCLFIDDNPENAAGAAAAGIDSFTFRSDRETAREVERRGAGGIPVESLLRDAIV